MREPLLPPTLRPGHRDRLAIAQVRPSTPQQVLDPRGPTARPYAWADRAGARGGPRDRALTIDDDLGESGQSIEGRPGPQRLLAEAALDHVGLILGREMSRLARGRADWHQPLELCGRHRVPSADAEGICDPAEYSDRLRPGPRGVMSEAERHALQRRTWQGKSTKARRGGLLGMPPIGSIRLATGEWAIDPDEQVQAVARLIFDQFDRAAAPRGLLRPLVRHQVRIPVRVAGGPSQGQLAGRRPSRAAPQDLRRHPTYAGACRFGPRPTDPRERRPGRPSTGKLPRRPEGCRVLLRDRVPAHLAWERCEANQGRRAANRNLPRPPGAPGNGPALVGGSVRRGRWGRRMVVRPGGPKPPVSYTCARGPAD